MNPFFLQAAPFFNGAGSIGGLGSPILLYNSAASATRSSGNVAGDATFQALASLTIPGRTMGPNSLILIDYTWSCTNSANVKSMVTKFGGTIFRTTAMTNNATLRDTMIVQNANSLSAQIGGTSTGSSGGVGTSANALVTTAFDTTTDLLLEIGMNWAGATSAEAAILRRYTVQLIG